MLIGQVLRASSFLAVERLVRSSARRALAVSTSCSDDALGYFTERLDPTFTRAALACVLRQAKRNKAFETSGGIGLAVEGTTVGRCASSGEIIEAFWLTNSAMEEVSSRVLYHRAKSRWEIENQGFNDATNRHGLGHICHHRPNSLLITWLLTSLGLTLERLYRLRYLRRGTHPLRTAAEFVYVRWLSLSRPAPADTS